jgi:FkbM family methyltransferase
VISFEAQERIFYALAGNIIMNNCFNARAIWAAVGASAGEIGVPIPDYHQPSSYGSLEIVKTENTEFIGQKINYHNTQPTQLLSIDDMKLDRVDFIKIDIEGMEIQALHGASETIERAKPLMLIEHIKSNITDIDNFLSNFGYKSYPMGINIFAIHKSDPMADQIKIEN